MRKVKVYGKVQVWVYQTVEVDDDATIEDIIEKAEDEFEGIETYMGNGGMDKMIGVSDPNKAGIEYNSDTGIDFAPNGEVDIEDVIEED